MFTAHIVAWREALEDFIANEHPVVVSLNLADFANQVKALQQKIRNLNCSEAVSWFIQRSLDLISEFANNFLMC